MYLELTEGKIGRITLTGNVVTLGRGEGNNIIVDDAKVSSNHCYLKPEGSFYGITDLMSTNGTWVNGERIKHKLLQRDDVIGIGSTRFILNWSDELEPVAELHQTQRSNNEMLDTSTFEIAHLLQLKEEIAERQTAEAERDAFFTAALDLLCIIGFDGYFRLVNNRWHEVLGHPTDDLNGQRLTDFLHPDERDEVALRLQSFEEGGDAKRFEARIRCMDGSYRWLSWSMSASVSQRRIFGAARDVTRRKMDEWRLTHNRERLRGLAARLTLAEERERRRISSNLHDQVIQTLGLCRIQLGALQASEPDAMSGKVDEIRELLDSTIRDCRSLIFELSPPLLYELGFVPALEWLCERTQEKFGFLCPVIDDGEPKPLRKDVEVMLFQAIRELLLNTGKYAKAKNAKVTLSREAESVELTVEDDGVGFDPHSIGRKMSDKGGYGLFGIRERLETLGGSMRVASDSGTRIVMIVPIEEELNDESRVS